MVLSNGPFLKSTLFKNICILSRGPYTERGIASAKPFLVYDSTDLLLYSIFTSGFLGTSGFVSRKDFHCLQNKADKLKTFSQ